MAPAEHEADTFERDEFDFADFSLTSHEFHARTMAAGVPVSSMISPSSDNGRSLWEDED